MTINVPAKHIFSSEQTVNQIYHVNKGEGIAQHSHANSHITICHNGSIIIRKANKEVIATKESGAFNLLEGEWHEIEALEDNTVFCNIFTIKDGIMCY